MGLRRANVRAIASSHSDRIAQAFSTQAAAFEDGRFNRVFTTDVQWVFERLELRADDLLLDVAAGTGHAARSLASSVRAAVAIDATPAMLEAGAASAQAEGIRNLVFQRGDAAALPYLDASFDVVVCRFAVHHFEQPRAQIGEMIRCLRPGGRLALADLVADQDPQLAARQNRLERLRDNSHTRMLTLEELCGLLDELDVIHVDTRETERPLAPWLDQARTGEEAAATIRAALGDELRGGEQSGLRPRASGGALMFVQRFASLVAVKPAR